MGVRGKKILGLQHKKALSPGPQSKDAGWGNPPHPVRVVRGMRFWPRAGKRRRPFEVRAIVGDVIHGRRFDDDGGQHVRVTLARLLAVRDDGQGLHYQFGGYKPGRYRTHAVVHSLHRGRAVLVLPDWHPRRPVDFPLELIPGDAREPGCWLRCQADLSVASAARMNIARLVPCAPPLPGTVHLPAYDAPPTNTRGPRPETGEGCGDIVLERTDGIDALTRRGGLLDVYAPKRPADVGPGDRVYLSLVGDDHIDAYLVVERIQQAPMGALLRCQPGAVLLDQAIAVRGERQQNLWRWRWWPREPAPPQNAQQAA